MRMANTAADPARERIKGNWLGKEEGRLALVGTRSFWGLEVGGMGVSDAVETLHQALVKEGLEVPVRPEAGQRMIV